jgi:hypothetical protein
MVGGGNRRFLAIPSLRLLGILGQVEREITRDGFPGQSSLALVWQSRCNPVLRCRFRRPQEIIMFLQRLPTDTWKDHDVELLLSEAFVLKSVWQGAENHFNGGTEGPLGGGMGGR